MCISNELPGGIMLLAQRPDFENPCSTTIPSSTLSGQWYRAQSSE